MTVLIVAFTAVRRAAVVDDCEFLLDQGVDVELVTLRADDWPELANSRVRIREVAPAEAGQLLPRLARGVIFRAPASVLTAVRTVVGLLDRLPLPSVASARLRRGLARAERFVERGSNGVHNRIWMRFYRMVRPWVLWQAVRTGVLPKLDIPGVDSVVIKDVLAVPTGGHLARRNARLNVRMGLDRTSVASAT